MDIDEMSAMLKELNMDVTNQLLRIILSIFDKNEDQLIDVEEFKDLL
jgi:Ca2+-binding EF-hand superfamily protein